MYFYLACRGRKWNPAVTLIVFASSYNDYESGDHLTPATTEDFDGLTIIAPLNAQFLVESLDNGGRVSVYSYLPDAFVLDKIARLRGRK